MWMLPCPQGNDRSVKDWLTSDFSYNLPASAIAQCPAEHREDSRLLLLSRNARHPASDRTIRELPDLVMGNELLVFNDVKVVPARLYGTKESGGRVELLVLNAHEGEASTLRVLARASKPLRPGSRITVGGLSLEVLEGLGNGEFKLSRPENLHAFLETHGQLPLPPYIDRPTGPVGEDLTRYQTVFSQSAGAVAAPTAGLHFTRELMERLRERGCSTAFVTLYVGLGTFLPVRAERVQDHVMHLEHYEIPEATAQAIRQAKGEGRPVLAVGTTVVRTLEGSAATSIDGLPVAERAATDLFITPGYSFAVVDQLLTNFHLPGSTLLMLVSAFAGREQVLAYYQEAVSRGYRFYSYGDGMLIR
jgi:S-adenosylmethionine:tRNA ribosyltransferase-isomerase